MNKKNILIIDDNYDIVNMLKQILETRDYTIFTANDVLSAKEIYFNNDFYVVICDLSLTPYKYDGLDLIEEFKNVKTTNFIIFSGYPNNLEKEKLEKLEIKGFLNKPFIIDDLFKLLDELER